MFLGDRIQEIWYEYVQNGRVTMPDPKYNIGILPAGELEDGMVYAKIIGIHKLTGTENQGNHNIFIEPLDEEGNRLDRWVLFHQIRPTGSMHFVTMDKPPSEPAGNVPINRDTYNDVKLYEDGLGADYPSETAYNISAVFPDEESGNSWHHHSFLVVFKLETYKDDTTTPPTDGERKLRLTTITLLVDPTSGEQLARTEIYKEVVVKCKDPTTKG